MVNLVCSPRLEDLVLQLARDLREAPLSNPLAREIIVVPEKYVGRWLDLRIAQLNGTATLPERVTFFGISAISPAYVDILAALGQRTPVRLYSMNPSSGAWAAFTPSAGDVDYDSGLLQFPSGNTILGSFGNQPHDFFGALQRSPGVTTTQFGATFFAQDPSIQKQLCSNGDSVPEHTLGE